MTKAETEKLLKENEALKAQNQELTEELNAQVPAAPKEVKLPEEVAKKYNLVNWKGSPAQLFGTRGLIDVSKLTIEKADQLYKTGWKRLTLKEPK